MATTASQRRELVRFASAKQHQIESVARGTAGALVADGSRTVDARLEERIRKLARRQLKALEESTCEVRVSLGAMNEGQRLLVWIATNERSEQFLALTQRARQVDPELPVAFSSVFRGLVSEVARSVNRHPTPLPPEKRRL
jgi:2-succinyl-5-enolpyruvyl-6-hydroxy-3-cyclohexene-1-carboxylate synthase